jgi:GET complex subunit GET2
MMNLLQQMMGGVPGEGSDGMPAFPGMAIPTVASEPYAYLWRIVHAVFAVGLGLYIAFMTPFTGSKAGREASAMSYLPVEGAASSGLSPASVHFFWIFSTAEVLLQTSRFFVEKGRVQQGTVLGIISGFLPEPYKGYLALVTRYSRIWTTVSADAMTLVFVLGACAWWKSM